MRGAVGARRWRAGVLATVMLSLLAVILPSGPPVGAQEDERPPRALLVSFPRLTWERLDEVRPPALMEFLEDGAVASLSPRTVGARTTPAQAYLTIGAGNRATAVGSGAGGLGAAGVAAAADEMTAEGQAAVVFERRTGLEPDGGVLSLFFPAQVNRNERLLYGAEPGSFGQALRDADIGTGVVGNAGTSVLDQSTREVVLAMADRHGQVTTGQVGGSLLEEDPLAPFGVRANLDAHVRAIEDAWRDAGVVLVEMSDLERAEQARPVSTSQRADDQFAAALEHADDLFARLLDTVDPERDLVIVLAPTAPLNKEQLTLFGAQGPAFEPGMATSSTTRRAGYATLTDLAPTVLRFLDVEVPAAMGTTVVSSVGDGGPLEDRIDSLVRANERAIFRDTAVGPLTVAFIVLLVAMLAAVAVFVARGATGERALASLRVFALTVLAVPTVMYLSGLLPYGPFTTGGFLLVVLAGAVVIALVANTLRRVAPIAPPLAVAALCLLVLLVDVVTGEHLQIDTVFGYSPIVAGRFAGYGNQAFALVGICTLVVATAGWELSERRRPGTPRSARVAVLLTLFAVVVVLVGAPMWGSDVGGVLAAVPAFAVCALLLNERRVDLRTATTIGVASVAVLGAFALLDLTRPEESRTHLGRFVESVLDGDALVILQRKLTTNLNILTSTVWTFTIPVALLFFAYITWRPNGLIRRIQDAHPSFRALGISGLTLGIVAFALNDSGIALPAMMLGIVLPYTAYLALGVLPADGEVHRRSASGSEPTLRSEVAGDDVPVAAERGRE